MTALERYVRLEATGVWREGRATPPREVIVALGKATLILRDLDETPLGHWALAGMRVLAEHDGATVYSTTDDGAETLTIGDREMVEAIASVARADLAPRPPWRAAVRRRRPAVWPLALVAALAAAGWDGPGLLRAQAVRMLPPEQAQEFGDQMLLTLMEDGGGLCDAAAGRLALDKLAAAVAEAPARLRVLALGATQTAALPGRTVLVNRTTLADAAAPEEVAGWVALALGRAPAEALMRAAGPVPVARYVFTGALGPAALARATEAALAPPTPAEGTAAMARLAAAGIDARPFAEALRRAGLLTAPPPAPEGAGTPLLTDREWLALKGICT